MVWRNYNGFLFMCGTFPADYSCKYSKNTPKTCAPPSLLFTHSVYPNKCLLSPREVKGVAIWPVYREVACQFLGVLFLSTSFSQLDSFNGAID